MLSSLPHSAFYIHSICLYSLFSTLYTLTALCTLNPLQCALCSKRYPLLQTTLCLSDTLHFFTFILNTLHSLHLHASPLHSFNLSKLCTLDSSPLRSLHLNTLYHYMLCTLLLYSGLFTNTSTQDTTLNLNLSGAPQLSYTLHLSRLCKTKTLCTSTIYYMLINTTFRTEQLKKLVHLSSHNTKCQQ